jgi:hypothetical protein
MSDIARVGNESNFLTVQEVIAGANLIQQVMKAVMKEGTHYGKIPGCGDKPTLFKAGAEQILTTFRIAVIPVVEDLSTNDCVKYRVVARGMSSGNIVGEGIGQCSSGEEKYKWRKAIGKEFDETPETHRRMKWKKGWNGAPETQEKQVRTSPDDLSNTVLKMAKKRAMVDLCLTATAASDCFNQDLEDLPAEYVDMDEQKQVLPEIPKRKSSQATAAEVFSASVEALREKPTQRPIPSVTSEEPDLEPPLESEAPAPKPRAENKLSKPVGFVDDFRAIKGRYPTKCKNCEVALPVGAQFMNSKTMGNYCLPCFEVIG